MKKTERIEAPEPVDDFGAGGVRLTPSQWIVTLLTSFFAFLFIPGIWRQWEEFEPSTGYRMPYTLSEDYWHYDRWSEHAAEAYDVLVIGDSVVWGEYVRPGESIAGQLAARHPGRTFANLGVNGIHPASLHGLLEHHGQSIRDTEVILHCNLLWMSSPKHDLTGEKEFRFNHPRLAPQLWTRIPCYAADMSERIGIAIERHVGLWNWTRHVRIAYFDSQDLHRWTIDHPGESIREQFTFRLPEPSLELRHSAVPWNVRGGRLQDFDWVDPASSFQWKSFRSCVELLRARGNRVAVVIGPFNTHLLSEKGLMGHSRVKVEVMRWLENEGVAFVSPAVLPSEMYADASHPLEAGYARLAESIPVE